MVQSKRSPTVVSPATNCTVVHSDGRAVSTSASATATAIAVPPNSSPVEAGERLGELEGGPTGPGTVEPEQLVIERAATARR